MPDRSELWQPDSLCLGLTCPPRPPLCLAGLHVQAVWDTSEIKAAVRYFFFHISLLIFPPLTFTVWILISIPFTAFPSFFKEKKICCSPPKRRPTITAYMSFFLRGSVWKSHRCALSSTLGTLTPASWSTWLSIHCFSQYLFRGNEDLKRKQSMSCWSASLSGERVSRM